MSSTIIDQNRIQIETLTRINIQDMLDNLGLSKFGRGRGLVRRLFQWPAELFARQVAHFDERVGKVGLQIAAHELFKRYVNRLDIIGVEHIPASGAVVIAANHPGMTDTLACFASIPRSDLRVVSGDRPFIRALPNIAQRTLIVPANPLERFTVVRQISRYLKGGGAVLICPAGQIEPDPAVMPGAIESLTTWSDSLGLFMRLAPECVVIPTVVSNVVHGPSLYNMLTRMRHEKKDRERMAATFQAFLHSTELIRRKMNVRIEFGRPLYASSLIPLGNATAITATVTEAVKSLILCHASLTSSNRSSSV